MRVLTLQHEAGKLNILNLENEMGFTRWFQENTNDFKHKSDQLFNSEYMNIS